MSLRGAGSWLRFSVARSYSNLEPRPVYRRWRKERRPGCLLPPWRHNHSTAGRTVREKYPFIKVDATRIGSERMATRLVAEAQGRKVRTS